MISTPSPSPSLADLSPYFKGLLTLNSFRKVMQCFFCRYVNGVPLSMEVVQKVYLFCQNW